MQVTVSLTVELPASAGVDEVESKVLEAGRRAMRAALRGACREYEQEITARGCPGCGVGADSLRTRGTRRRVVVAVFGRTVLQLRRLRCERCGHRFRPAQAFLEGLKGANITQRLRGKCATTGSSAASYKAAARQIESLGGARVDPETVRTCTNEAGAKEAERQVREAETRHSPTAESISVKREQQPQPPPQLMIVGLDGGWIASRDQPGGMEGKLGVVSTELEPVGLLGRQKLTQRLLVGTFGPSKQLGVLTCAAAIELGGHEASRQSVLGDGAGWIKTQARQHCGAATKILDWSHLWRAVAKAVRAARGGQEYKCERKRLYECLRESLWRGKVSEALRVLEGLRQAGQPVTALEAAIQYLNNQRDWIGDYEAWREAGYSVGSGMVERQVELVINRRLKRRGMRWLRVSADAVLALRLTQLNADWHYKPQADKLAA